MTNDWEDLMSGVFGGGGRLNLSGEAGKADAQKAKNALAAAQKELEATLARTTAAKKTNDVVSSESLQQNSDALSEALRRQSDEIRSLGGELASTLEKDGLITPAQAQAAQPGPDAASTGELFAQVAEAAGQKIIGQQEFVSGLLAGSLPDLTAEGLAVAESRSLEQVGKQLREIYRRERILPPLPAALPQKQVNA